jgi:methyltransferase family protein
VTAVAARPPYVPPGHYYSPLSSRDDAERAVRSPGTAPGVDLREEGQTQLARDFAAMLAQPLPGPRYVPENRMYGPADAAVYRAMLRRYRPRQVIEAGSGYSTAVALDEAGALPGLRVTCIEPYPDRLLGLLRPGDWERTELTRQPVQDVPLSRYEVLGPGDMLVVDSTHVVKPGSDVAHLVLEVFPRLRSGVLVHVHDVFWPFTYPARWLREGRDWTEAYLLQAFLVGNTSWEVAFFSSWVWARHPELVPEHLVKERPGSLWLRKTQ